MYKDKPVYLIQLAITSLFIISHTHASTTTTLITICTFHCKVLGFGNMVWQLIFMYMGAYKCCENVTIYVVSVIIIVQSIYWSTNYCSQGRYSHSLVNYIKSLFIPTVYVRVLGEWSAWLVLWTVQVREVCWWQRLVEPMYIYAGKLMLAFLV